MVAVVSVPTNVELEKISAGQISKQVGSFAAGQTLNSFFFKISTCPTAQTAAAKTFWGNVVLIQIQVQVQIRVQTEGLPTKGSVLNTNMAAFHARSVKKKWE